MTAADVDILLLNASNFPEHPIFPYAFIQLSALAREYNLTLKSLELMLYDMGDWENELWNACNSLNPKIIFITIRQADSQYIGDYVDLHSTGNCNGNYFSLERTSEVIHILKRINKIPILIGGFGFTVHPERILNFLQPNYGCLGEADDIFQNFNKLIKGEGEPQGLLGIKNLVFKNGAEYFFNEREYYPPLDKPEYNDEIFQEILLFYASIGRSISICRIGEVSFPVEVSRGCPGKCYFCTEPAVKGKKIKTRSIDAIM